MDFIGLGLKRAIREGTLGIQKYICYPYVKQNGKCIQKFASEQLKADKEVVLACCETKMDMH